MGLFAPFFLFMKSIFIILIFFTAYSLFAYDIPEGIDNYTQSALMIEQLKCMKEVLVWENIVYKIILFLCGLIASLIFALKWKV